MNGVSATESPTHTPVLVGARTAGVFYLLNITTILLAIFLFRKAAVSHDPASAAASVLAHEVSLRLGIALEVISTACSLVIAVLFYELFRPVNRTISLIAAFFRLLACAVAVVGYVFQIAPMQILKSTPQLSSHDFYAMAILLNRVRGSCSDIVILIFGFHFVLIGYLIVTSRFLPRFLGVLAALSGLLAMTFLAPSLAIRIFPYIAGVGLLTELSLTVWLLAVGVNAQQWDANGRT